MIWARMLAYITGTVDQSCPAKNSVQIEIVAFTEPQPVTFPGHADSTFVSARLFPGSCLSASRDSCSPTSASGLATLDRKSTRLNSSHSQISYAVFCLKKNKTTVPHVC